MKKKALSVLVAALLIFQLACIQGITALAADEQMVQYSVEIYMMDIYDEYQLNLTEQHSAAESTYVEVTPEEYEGFTFNENLSITYQIIDISGDTVFRLYYDRNEYTVYFSVAGEPYEEYLLYYGAPIEAPPNPTPPDGYRFVGWYSSIPATMPSHDIHIDGGWIAQEYLINFMVDDTVFASYFLSYGTDIVPPFEIPSKEGHTFVGWDSLPEKMPPNDLQVNSLWDTNDYTMTFYLNGEVYAQITQPYGSAVEAPSVDVEENYSFSGWSPFVPEAMPGNDTQYHATYGVEQFNIILPESNDYTIQPVVEGSTSASYGGSYSFRVIIADAFDRSDITVFANGIEVAPTGVIYTIDNITEDIEITITGIKINIYSVTFKNEGYNDVVFQVMHGQILSVIPEIPNKAGYSISRWDIDLEDTPIYQDHICNAVYIVTKRVDFYVSGSGEILASGSTIRQFQSIEYEVGDVITVTAQDGIGKFLYWVDIATNKIISYDYSLTFTVATNFSYRALFAPYDDEGFTITYLNNAKGIIFSEFVEYTEGYDIPEPSPLPGFTFMSWDKTYQEVMDAHDNVVVSPIYQVNPEVFTIDITNSYGVSGEGEYDAYSIATVTAYDRDFSYWIDNNGEIVSYDRNYSFYINYNAVITAVYGEDVPALKAATRITTFNKDYDNNRLTFYAERSAHYQLNVVQSGIMLTKIDYIGESEDLFILEDEINVLRGICPTNVNDGTYSLAKKNWNYESDTWYARSYLIVADGLGNQTTIYSNIVCVPHD